MPENVPFLSIIFPAHNEEQRLAETLRNTLEFTRSQPFESEILVVENASSDTTLDIANFFAADNPSIRVISLDQPGKGRAVKTGMLAARGRYRFICDVDLSMPVGEISRFLPPQIKNMDIVIASREAPGSVRYDEPHYRHFVGRIFNNLVRWTLLPQLQDTQCGFKCFKDEVVETIFPLVTIPCWTFDVEVLAIAFKRGFRVAELPIPWYYHPHSKVNVLRDSTRMALDLLKIRRKLRRGDYDPAL